MKNFFQEIKESFFLSLGNNLPRLILFNRYRFKLFRLAGVQIIGNCNFWSGFDVRPIGSCNKLTIDKNVFINRNFRCAMPKDSTIFIGEDSLIGPNVSIENGSHGLIFDTINGRGTTSQSVIIGAKCWIGANCIILGGVVVGENCVIAAGSVVTKKHTRFFISGRCTCTCYKKNNN